MIIKSNDIAIERELKALEKTILKEGGWIHPDFSIQHNNETGLSVYMSGNCTPHEIIVKIPENLLIPANHINIAVRNNEFIINPDVDNLTNVQIEITELMFSIFNLTKKVPYCFEKCPWIKFREAPDLFDLLLTSRSLNSDLEYRKSFLHGINGNTSIEDFVTGAFITSRVFGYKSGGDEAHSTRVFMPLIDYMNHDYRGSSYYGEQQINIRNSQPFVYSRESFTSYGMHDGLDMFLTHGFYDQEAPFIRSIPLEIPIEGVGKIVVYSFSDNVPGVTLPKQMGDLQKFMPSASRLDDGNIELAHLIITVGQFPHALRRILLVIIKSFTGEQASYEFIIEQAKSAEKFIINKNTSFYQSLLIKLDGNIVSPPALVSDIREIAEFQLNKLYKYHFDDSFFDKTMKATSS